jgi:hypothetical protein
MLNWGIDASWNRILSCPREELLVLREAGLEEAQKGRVGMIQLTP